jgi:penicillin-binding protein 1A
VLRGALLTVLAVGVAAVAASVVAGARYLHATLNDCTLAGCSVRALPSTSFVYAANGALLETVPAPLHREPVPYGSISRWAFAATVAAEDRTFWTNSGLDYRSIARAALADLEAGRAVQGASTITQQLVRSFYLNNTKTLARKRLEACLAVQLTKHRNKRWILTEYVNRIPYGEHALGIEAAARTYFGLPASRLGPVQAALLAGLPQAPSIYDPFAHPVAATVRRNEVLRAMWATHAISAADYRRYRSRPLGLHSGLRYATRQLPNFVGYVEAQLGSVYGRARVANGGLRVYTTIEPRAQRIALAAMRRTLGHRGDPGSALAAIDPRTGSIEALASNWQGHRLEYDLASQGRGRQTGSAFKTFVLTDAVWLHHADPNRTWYDSAPFTYKPTPRSKPWRPRTYENTFFGPETLTKATLLSDNVVYAKLTLDLGPRSVARVAHRMGIHSPLQAVPSIGLGSNSVTPLTLASAYATLAAGGVYHRPFAIRKVVLAQGRTDRQHRWGVGRAVRVLPRGAAWTVTKVLEANVRHGTGIAAQIAGRHVAGKTGTTSDWTDAWFAGYTPSLTTVTWVGYPRRARSMTNVHGIRVAGATFPAQIWHAFVAGVLGHSRPLAFRSGWWPLHPYHGKRAMSGPRRHRSAHQQQNSTHRHKPAKRKH